MKILLAVDGSTYSDDAVKEVASRPWPDRSEVRVISVVEPPPPPTPETWGAAMESYLSEMEQWATKQARITVENAAKILRAGVEKTLSITTAVLTGSPRLAILDESEAWGADLIVVGSHGYGFWQRVVLGSVSQAVASHAKCSVEIVRRRRAGENQ
jgi:nucleotide-binding universal stress UspA family protein